MPYKSLDDKRAYWRRRQRRRKLAARAGKCCRNCGRTTQPLKRFTGCNSCRNYAANYKRRARARKRAAA